MKARTELVLEGVGAALLFVPWLPYLDKSNQVLYIVGPPLTNLIGGILVDMLGVAILATGFLVAVQYLPRTLQRSLNALFAGLMLWRIMDIAVTMQTHMSIIVFWYGMAEAELHYDLAGVGRVGYIPSAHHPAFCAYGPTGNSGGCFLRSLDCPATNSSRTGSPAHPERCFRRPACHAAQHFQPTHHMDSVR